jgi:hypothetical protein
LLPAHTPNPELEDVMPWKIIVLASAAALAGVALLASSMDATALRLRDDVYYYSGVTPAFGHTPRRYLYSRYCARRFRSYDPLTGTYIDRHGVRRPCP